MIPRGTTIKTSLDGDAYVQHVNLQNVNVTRFQELKTAMPYSHMNFKPTWGVTTRRYKVTATGTGAQADEIGGEIQLQSGTSTDGIATVRTLERGQYQAGAMAQFGAGIRIPVLPTGTQFIEWGYTDFSQSGFFFGVDAIDLYVGYIRSGVTTKIYRTDWTEDKLDGTGESGYDLDLADGHIAQIDFTWYGYGDIAFAYYTFDEVTRKIERTVVHRLKINQSTSIDDPNQPIAFRVGNGATSNTNLSLYVGGHQFSVIDGETKPNVRKGIELLSNYTTATNTNWQPLISFRKKATFRNRPNSVLVIFNGYELAADGELETRVTFGGVTSNLNWGTPTDYTASETACETKVTGATALTASATGTPIEYGFVSGVNKSAQMSSETVEVPVEEEEIILWIRRLSSSGAVVVKHAHLSWEEEW